MIAAPLAAQNAADFFGRASVDPPIAEIGERVTYRGRVALPLGHGRVRWVRPDSVEALTWGPLRARIATTREGSRKNATSKDSRIAPTLDTLIVETTLQAFRAGVLRIPGLVFEEVRPEGAVRRRLPDVPLSVTSILAANDSNPQLRPPRGPIAAPWWERVPWMMGGTRGAADRGPRALRDRGSSAGGRSERRWRCRRRSIRRRARWPSIAALRTRGLPTRGDFDAHAFELTRILRRYLEVDAHAQPPGRHDAGAARSASPGSASTTGLEHARLADLLRHWDVVKFARARVERRRGARPRKPRSSRWCAGRSLPATPAQAA